MLSIGRGERELFWDDFIIDTQKTTAKHKLHFLTYKGTVINHDEEWEGDCCNYHNIVEDNGLYRLYYIAGKSKLLDLHGKVYDRSICYAESRDGINWEKPSLNICEYNGKKNNNIVFDDNSPIKATNLFVFKDNNPNCPSEERYKAVCVIVKGKKELHCLTSKDGIHFSYGWLISKKGAFDSLNTALWDDVKGKYMCFYRDFHNVPEGDYNYDWRIRDIRYIESDDFKKWSEPQLLNFGNADDYPLYTNVISKYYRSRRIFTGFPTRYAERKLWHDNFEELCGRKARRKRMDFDEKRAGLALTDCVFMTSRDGTNWNRWDEAFVRPGAEQPLNWVYGDCYPALGMIETPSDIKGADNEISMYILNNHFSGVPTILNRYSIRTDGFVSVNATYAPKLLTTKPFVFSGNTLRINFSTSALGYLHIKIKDENGNGIYSDETFGDSINRKVHFQNGSLTSFAGKPVVMEIIMSDADIYSFILE